MQVESRKLRIPAARLRLIVKTVLEALDHEVRLPQVDNLSVVFINDAEMRAINKTHRGKDKPTDVLSFPQFEPSQIQGRRRVIVEPGACLGDLVISTETTLRQAVHFEVTKEEELVRLVVHGLLHLCGYDHEGVSRNEAERMRSRERRIRRAVLSALPSSVR